MLVQFDDFIFFEYILNLKLFIGRYQTVLHFWVFATNISELQLVC